MAAWGLYHRSTGQCATKYTNTWEDEATRKDMKDTTLLGPGEVLQICLFIAAAGGEVLQICLSIAAAGKGSAERGREVQNRARKEVPHPVHHARPRIFLTA